MGQVVPAEGSTLERVLATTPLLAHGLSPEAFATFEAAQARTVWAARHRRRFALVESGEVLASAARYELTGTVDGQLANVCAIAALPNSDPDPASVGMLVEQLLDDATGAGADLALVFGTDSLSPLVAHGFDVIPTTQVELTTTESARHGAPMVLVRGGEARDLAAIAAMGGIRARPFRFHLDRDTDFIQHAITRKRLLAGLTPSGDRRLEFVIAEEGITAAAYLVMSIVGHTWVIEECGDRDASGARVGALLQALIARDPAESRPVIRGWLPPAFVPPQTSIRTAAGPAPVLLARMLSSRLRGVRFSAADVLYWLADVF